MPASYSMTWEPKPRRWRKMYRGQMYVVSCRELGVNETKENSYQAANAWWALKKAEIDGETRWPNHEFVEDLIAERNAAVEMGAFPEALELHGKLVRVANPNVSPDQAETIILEDDPDLSPYRIALARKAGITIPEGVDSNLLEYIFGATRTALDRRHRQPRDYKDSKLGDKSVAAQVDRFLALERSRVESKAISVGELELVTRALHDFQDWIVGGTNIDQIDADRLEGWWSHLAMSKLSVETKKKKMRHSKTFIHWLSEKGLIPQPPNLYSRRHRFGGSLKAVPTVPTADVKDLIEAASGQLRLHLLLMINCGMTQIDISDLKPQEVDWDKGRVKRKRSKTEDHADVPVVDYLLWPETLDLLKNYGKKEGERALLTESGRPWVRDVLKPDGKRSKVDNIKSNFAHLKKRLNLPFSMKLLRKTSATLLDQESRFGDRIATLFLGHSPRSIKDRHYSRPAEDVLDEALRWLRGQYFKAYVEHEFPVQV